MIKAQTLLRCIFLFLKASFASAATYHCENGNTQIIHGESSGTIRTVEAGSSTYANNLNCGWMINGGTGNKIQLTVTGLNLQHSPSYTSCGTYDHLSIRDGDTSNADEITAICGSKNPHEIISSGQYLYLNFYTNDKNFYDHTGVTVNFQVFDDSGCPPSWTNLNTTDQCYRIKQVSSIDWNSAFSNCLYSQANLAVIDDHQVFDSLVAYGNNISVTSAWIGLTDIETEDSYKWLNNHNLASYIRLEGNNEDNDCAILNFNTQRFIMQDCERDKHLAVCQRKKVGVTEPYPIPKEKEEETEVVSLRWKIILGISAGVILVIICFVLYCCLCRKSKPTIPGDSSRSVNYLPGTTSYHQNTRHKQITSSSNRHHENSHCNQNRHSQPPRYSDIPRNPQLNIPTTGTVQFNPQINVNVTVNGNPGQGDPPPAYTFYSHTG